MMFNELLAQFSPVDAPSISHFEHISRLSELQRLMRIQNIDGLWLDASSSLRYFCGLSLNLSERIHGAVILQSGAPIYISPTFEQPKLESLSKIEGEIQTWEEHEDPYALIAGLVPQGVLALDPATPWLFAAPLNEAFNGRVISAQAIIASLRRVKSPTELAIIEIAMQASWRVQRAVYQGLHEGVTTTEVCAFIDQAHRALGMKPLFSAVQFGEATAYPHGVPYPQTLKHGDMVLVDLGATLQGYQSDITRSYVFGTPSPRQREVWQAEYNAHQAAFAAAQIGATCESVDAAARRSLENDGYGPGYQIPGLPHRTGHGLGLDIHEEPYIVQGNQTILTPGMCFSIEPMLCIYGECGVRLEDIIMMTSTGPRSFVPPARSIDNPFDTTPETDAA